MDVHGLIDIEDFLRDNRGKGLERAFEGWIEKARRAKWQNFADIRDTFRHVDRYRQCFIFDVGGNKARLIAHVDFESKTVVVMRVLTHKEYDRDRWKECCG